MTSVIDLHDVSWRRQQENILSDINWHVEKGEHWAVLGLNGSGKTSLLNIVTGYSWPTAGQVRVLGQPFGKIDIRTLRKSIGWVSSSLQSRIKETELTEDIVVSGKYASIGLAFEEPAEADFEKAFRIMEQIRCGYLIGRTYQTCSQGERQKLLIARGLMASPDLLLLDESTSGLDFIAREELLSTIQKLTEQADAPTIIFVTHHIEEVLPAFSRTLLLREGSVFAKGSSETILTTDNLSRFYGMPVNVEWHRNRPWITLQD
ncbi:ABC transporter ATP-binding protein [Lentibacillus amyloliquefaciens]|uniref:Molybdenum ABC transporter ATP-binding protein n=1 Tax=Lentibacillus amyloliquefaciens TaxID=1472767 RepID=A0A0U4FR60_9BACI|nr:ABC transporter ATP-binding protein [Lentibacillus amyloliquefaciens]ALX50196.1 molybdenum ABC transporter ATP-binding protein [Lentibacillus amyloliquefaciens]